MVEISHKLPTFASMIKHYPHGSVDDVKKLIGGRIDAIWVENTCVIRVSRVLNYTAYKIPYVYPGAYAKGEKEVISGEDGKWYIYRIPVLIKYLEKMYGKPQLHTKNAIKAKKFLKGKKGIIVFLVRWSNAVGHSTLWNGHRCIGERVGSDIGDCYFGKASEIYFWQARR